MKKMKKMKKMKNLYDSIKLMSPISLICILALKDIRGYCSHYFAIPLHPQKDAGCRGKCPKRQINQRV
jgi:hypothetical protein